MPTPAAPGDAPQASPTPPVAPMDNSAASNAALDNQIANFTRPSGVGSQSTSLSPNMIGDMGGSGPMFVNTSLMSSSSLPGGVYRRVKIAENNSPFVRHRIHMNYHHFHNIFTDSLGNDFHADRYTLGIERPFYDGRRSIEVRLPFFSTLNNDQTFGQAGNYGHDIGNITAVYKQYLMQTNSSVLSAGFGTVLPTAPDEQVINGAQAFRLENESVHLQPFIAYNERMGNCFVTMFAQLDFDLNGNTILLDGNEVGVFQDQNQLLLDLQVGHWFYRGNGGRVTGVAGLVELHYNGAIQDTDNIGGGTLTNPNNRFDILNLTSALHFQIGRSSNLRVGVVVPLKEDAADRQFDAEFLVQFNTYFR